ncbi:Flp family type IVb pilin [Vibrio penaeicida]|uniref:Flp family type IVb pilin n=1 Tax=Vibrio penaeicida TaxID=104609 RepID=UPI001F306CF4|nr:Flp family type IVb pilin [Vibrio penaeicida]
MLNTITNLLAKFQQDERGVTAVEYAIIAVVISGIILAAFNSGLGDAIKSAIGQITTQLGTATDAAATPKSN